MLKNDIIRAWRDPRYRMSLSSEAKARLPEHPAGVVELSDEDVTAATGGEGSTSVCFCPTSRLTTCCTEGTACF